MRSIPSGLGAVIIALCLVEVVLALGRGYQVMEQLEQVPDGWSRGSKPSPSTTMTFRLAVNQPHTTVFEQRVVDISTPTHPLYGQHMKREEIRELLRPDPIISDQILSWLDSEDVSPKDIGLDGNWITFKAAISQAERMLKTNFFYYHNHARQATVIRAMGYSVPREIHQHIQLIQPTTRFDHLSPQAALPLDQPIVATPEDLTADCGTVIRPDCIRDLYGLHNTNAKPTPWNRLGISGFLDQYARHRDFHQFMQQFSPNETIANFTAVSVNGGRIDEDSSDPSTEASLDLQYSVSLAHHTLTTYYSTGGRAPLAPDADQPDASNPGNEPYLEQLHYLVNLPGDELPAVLSTSYGESEQSVPESYAKAVCNLFAQLGARGVSVIFSSGDSGVGGSCLSNDGTNRTTFLPGFPASCPFVTSVGGVYGINPEKAIDFSGGGFSDLFPRPSYQDQAVKRYLDRLGDQWNGLYNPQGRGIPDVAAQAKNFIIRDHEKYLKISGTRYAAFMAKSMSAKLC